MNPQLKRQTFIDRIRKTQQEDYFRTIRMTLLSQQEPTQPKHLSANGQQ